MVYGHVPNSSLTHGEIHTNGVGSLSLALSTWDWLSFQEIGVHPKTRYYLVQQSPGLAEERTERKVMASTEQVLRRKLDEKCLRIPVGMQR